MSGGVGKTLIAARTAQGLELEDVEQRLKIRRRYLVALEEERWERLPAPAYARAFLRSYAALLGLDGDALVRRCPELSEPATGQAEEPRPAVSEPARRDRGPTSDTGPRQRPRMGPRLWWIVAMLGLAVAVGVLVHVVGGEGGPTPADRSDRPSSSAPQRSAGQPPGGEPERRQARVRLVATGAVWICVTDQNGEPLIDGVTFAAGDRSEKLRARQLEIGLGNGQVELKANGEQVPIASPGEPTGFRVTGEKVRELPAGERPTCS